MAEIQRQRDPNEEMVLKELFVHVVTMFSSTAMQALGKIPNPMTGKPEVSLETAQTMIALLEMLYVKTEGNLDKEEDHLIKNAIGSLQLMFVDEIESLKKQGVLGPDPSKTHLTENGSEVAGVATPNPEKPSDQPAHAPESKPAPDVKPADETRKRFTKKYE